MRYRIRNEYIVVSLSTTPHRINKIEPTIRSLEQQNSLPNAIYLNIPYMFKRDKMLYVIPSWLKSNKLITVLRTNDYGPATKLLGTLEKANLPQNAIIITVDDDAIYPANLILQLAYKAVLNPKQAIGIIGADIEYDKHGLIASNSELGFKKIKSADAFVNILQGYAGVAYRRSFFKSDIFDITTAPQECINSDDLYISYNLAKQNIPRQVLQNKYINSCAIRWETTIATDQHSLHKLIPKPVNKHIICLSYLRNLYPNVNF